MKRGDRAGMATIKIPTRNGVVQRIVPVYEI